MLSFRLYYRGLAVLGHFFKGRTGPKLLSQNDAYSRVTLDVESRVAPEEDTLPEKTVPASLVRSSPEQANALRGISQRSLAEAEIQIRADGNSPTSANSPVLQSGRTAETSARQLKTARGEQGCIPPFVPAPRSIIPRPPSELELASTSDPIRPISPVEQSYMQPNPVQQGLEQMLVADDLSAADSSHPDALSDSDTAVDAAVVDDSDTAIASSDTAVSFDAGFDAAAIADTAEAIASSELASSESSASSEFSSSKSAASRADHPDRSGASTASPAAPPAPFSFSSSAHPSSSLPSITARAIAPETQPITSSQITTRVSNPLHAEAMAVFVRQAKAYMQHQEWEKAIAACEEALAVAPDVAEAHKLIGNVLQEMGRGVDSMGHYARALLANPTFPEVYANLGSLYARQQAWEDAEIYYRKAIALRSDDPAFLKPLTKVLEAQGKSAEAREMFAQRVTLQPEDASAAEHFLAGNFFLEAEDEHQAIERYRSAVELDENFSQAYRPLADLLEKQGDWQSATLYYRKVLQAGLTADIPANSSQASSQNSADHPHSGEMKVRRIPSSNLSLQQLLQNAKQLRQKTPDLQTAAGSQAAQVTLAERGRSLGVEPSSQQQATATEQAAEQATEQMTEQAARYARSGQLQAKEENWPRAIEYYQESLKLSPRQPEVYRELARALTQAKQTEQAAIAWFRTFQLKPDWATAEQYYRLANNLVKQGKLEEGAVCYKQAIQREPQMAGAYENLGRVLELQNDPSGAAVAYRKALEIKGAVAAKK